MAHMERSGHVCATRPAADCLLFTAYCRGPPEHQGGDVNRAQLLILELLIGEDARKNLLDRVAVTTSQVTLKRVADQLVRDSLLVYKR
jgi:hypothetical protein